MSNQISKDSIERFEDNIKERGREIFPHWLKIKEMIGVDNIDFLLTEELYSEENKISVITKNSIFEIKLGYKSEPSLWFTTPFKVTEIKKKIKTKIYTYTSKSNWEINFVYDDESKIAFSQEVLKQFHPSEIDDNLFYYLISL